MIKKLSTPVLIIVMLAITVAGIVEVRKEKRNHALMEQNISALVNMYDVHRRAFNSVISAFGTLNFDEMTEALTLYAETDSLTQDGMTVAKKNIEKLGFRILGMEELLGEKPEQEGKDKE